MSVADEAKKEFVDKFVELLEQEGDMFLSFGSVSKDYDAITAVIRQQGYWAGNAVRYVFNKNLEFEGVQQRMFGS